MYIDQKIQYSKSQQTFFFLTDNLILRVTWIYKDLRVAKTILKKKSQDLISLNSKTYYKSRWCDTSVSVEIYINGTEGSKILTFMIHGWSTIMPSQQGKKVFFFFTNDLQQQDTFMQQMILDWHFTLYTEIYSKWFMGLNIKTKSVV